MSLHAKMEALRHWFSRAPVGCDPGTAEAQFWFSVRDVLREWSRPASERAKEWRESIAHCAIPNSARDEAERAITHAGDGPTEFAGVPSQGKPAAAAGDQGEMERVSQSEEDAIVASVLRKEREELQQHNLKLMARLLQCNQFIDKLVAALAQKGAT